MDMKEYIREFTTRDIVRVRSPRVVIIGGGTGLSVVLRGLKDYTKRLTAVVTMGDDGGSSGRLRDDIGLLPPGDIRSCILALADDETLMQELFNYRFESGSLKGHNFGNLFLAAMDGISADFYEAIRRTSSVLHIKGQVLPVTLDPMVLCAALEDGSVVTGESEIPQAVRAGKTAIDRLMLKDRAKMRALDDAVEAIREANIIIFGPGSLYTSLICNLLVPGIAQAVAESGAATYYIGNLMTQPGETDGYTQKDHVDAIERAAGRLFKNVVQHDGTFPPEIVSKYWDSGQTPVVPMAGEAGLNVITENLAVIENGRVRHNADAVARAVFEHYIGGKERGA